MLYYVAISKHKDFIILDEGEQFDAPDGFEYNGYPPFECHGGTLDVLAQGIEHITKCEKLHINFISMN